MNNKPKFEQAAQRKLIVESGFYDGRFMNKTMKDKKKHENKREARDWKHSARNYIY